MECHDEQNKPIVRTESNANAMTNCLIVPELIVGAIVGNLEGERVAKSVGSNEIDGVNDVLGAGDVVGVGVGREHWSPQTETPPSPSIEQLYSILPNGASKVLLLHNEQLSHEVVIQLGSDSFRHFMLHSHGESIAHAEALTKRIMPWRVPDMYLYSFTICEFER